VISLSERLMDSASNLIENHGTTCRERFNLSKGDPQFAHDRTIQKFKVIDRGDCTCEIQTIGGFDMGIYHSSQGYWLLTTRRDGVSGANETFQLVAYGLESEPVLH
jgi:hypothetical protein